MKGSCRTKRFSAAAPLYLSRFLQQVQLCHCVSISGLREPCYLINRLDLHIISPTGLAHIEGYPFISPAFVLDNIIAFTLARRIVMISCALNRMVMSVDRNRLVCIRIPRDAVVFPSQGNQPVFFTLRLRVVMLVAIVRI